MKKQLLAAALALALALGGCGAQPEEKTVEKGLGIKVDGVTHISAYDSHGGFLGDGVSRIALTFENGALEDQLAADPAWQSLPMDDTTRALVWGVEDETGSFGPLLTDGEGTPLVPPVERGYYRLIDRHSDQQSDILSRGSFNFTVGVYDADARILYYCELDT